VLQSQNGYVSYSGSTVSVLGGLSGGRIIVTAPLGIALAQGADLSATASGGRGGELLLVNFGADYGITTGRIDASGDAHGGVVRMISAGTLQLSDITAGSARGTGGTILLAAD